MLFRDDVKGSNIVRVIFLGDVWFVFRNEMRMKMGFIMKRGNSDLLKDTQISIFIFLISSSSFGFQLCLEVLFWGGLGFHGMKNDGDSMEMRRRGKERLFIVLP